MRASAADASARQQFNRELFTAMAPYYDRLTPWISFGRDGSWKRAMVRRLPDFDRPFCVDMACGTGDIALLLARRYPGGCVTGVDLTEAMLVEARRRDREGRIDFRCGDLTATGLPDRCADVVTGAYALRLCPGVEAGLAETARLLRPGGVASFLDFARPDSPAAQRILVALLRMWGGVASWWFHRSLRVYTYIPETLRHYPTRRGLHDRLAAAGFRNIRRYSFFFSVVDVWTAVRDG